MEGTRLKLMRDVCEMDDLPLTAEIVPFIDPNGTWRIVIKDLETGVEFVIRLGRWPHVERCWLAEV